MNLLAENKKQYFIIMLFELAILSCVYWMFFDFKFSSLIVYILAVGFYFTMYRIWLRIFDRKENFLFPPVERFSVISVMFLLFVLAVNSFDLTKYTDMFCVYTALFFIFLLYYMFRKKKQKKSPVSEIKFSLTMEILTAMCGMFLFFDLLVFIYDRLSLQLILYLPFLFLILSFIVCIYKKTFTFNSFSSLILFLNIYVMATLMLVVNYINFNYFSFMAIIHFILFSAAILVMLSNSYENESVDSQNSLENMALIFLNIVLIFISLNNILSMRIPEIFTSYLHFISILFVCYLGYKNYKML